MSAGVALLWTRCRITLVLGGEASGVFAAWPLSWFSLSLAACRSFLRWLWGLGAGKAGRCQRHDACTAPGDVTRGGADTKITTLPNEATSVSPHLNVWRVRNLCDCLGREVGVSTPPPVRKRRVAAG